MGELDGIKRVVGAKQVLKALEAESVKKVIFAEDADEKVVFRIRELCLQKQIAIESAESMKQLGKDFGIQVGASVVAILEQ